VVKYLTFGVEIMKYQYRIFSVTLALMLTPLASTAGLDKGFTVSDATTRSCLSGVHTYENQSVNNTNENTQSLEQKAKNKLDLGKAYNPTHCGDFPDPTVSNPNDPKFCLLGLCF